MQAEIEATYGARDRERGADAAFLWFIEEVGELASAIGGTDQKNKEEEFADVFGWLCSLANIQGVDMQQAVRDKFIDRDPGPPK